MTLSNLAERASLRWFSRDISDPAWLDRVWVRQDFNQKFDYPFKEVMNFFYDDTHYVERAEDHLGKSLLNAEEVAAVRRFVVALDTLLTATEGQRLTDADYLRTPQWPAVQEAAKELHALIVANDAKMAAT